MLRIVLKVLLHKLAAMLHERIDTRLKCHLEHGRAVAVTELNGPGRFADEMVELERIGVA